MARPDQKSVDRFSKLWVYRMQRDQREQGCTFPRTTVDFRSDVSILALETSIRLNERFTLRTARVDKNATRDFFAENPGRDPGFFFAEKQD